MIQSKEPLKASELRIGNWVSVKGKNLRVNAIVNVSSENIKSVSIKRYVSCQYGKTNRQYTLGELTPILITPEILLNSGFEICHEGRGEKRIDHIQHGYIGVIFHLDGSITFRYYSERDNIKIQYLHQLQNLFFSLTNQELIITL